LPFVVKKDSTAKGARNAKKKCPTSPQVWYNRERCKKHKRPSNAMKRKIFIAVSLVIVLTALLSGFDVLLRTPDLKIEFAKSAKVKTTTDP